MKSLIFNGSAISRNIICLLRVWCGIVFIKYGLSILHISSVEDFANTLQTANIPFPLLSAWLCKSTEFLGGILLVIGFLKIPACIFLIVDMTVATFVFHHGKVVDNGLTTFLLLLCLLTIFFSETDYLSIDYFIKNKMKKNNF
jgi:putative oxidoreductase